MVFVTFKSMARCLITVNYDTYASFQLYTTYESFVHALLSWLLRTAWEVAGENTTKIRANEQKEFQDENKSEVALIG